MRCVVTVADVRALALTLPPTTEHLGHDRVTFRAKQIVYCAFSRDETLMGFAFAKWSAPEVRVGVVQAASLVPGVGAAASWAVMRVSSRSRSVRVNLQSNAVAVAL